MFALCAPGRQSVRACNIRYFIKLKKKLIDSLGYKLNTLKYLFLKIIRTVCILDILTTYDSHLNKIAASEGAICIT